MRVVAVLVEEQATPMRVVAVLVEEEATTMRGVTVLVEERMQRCAECSTGMPSRRDTQCCIPSFPPWVPASLPVYTVLPATLGVHQSSLAPAHVRAPAEVTGRWSIGLKPAQDRGW